MEKSIKVPFRAMKSLGLCPCMFTMLSLISFKEIVSITGLTLTFIYLANAFIQKGIKAQLGFLLRASASPNQGAVTSNLLTMGLEPATLQTQAHRVTHSPTQSAHLAISLVVHSMNPEPLKCTAQVICSEHGVLLWTTKGKHLEFHHSCLHFSESHMEVVLGTQEIKEQ